jgi:hypothetical protein
MVSKEMCSRDKCVKVLLHLTNNINQFSAVGGYCFCHVAQTAKGENIQNFTVKVDMTPNSLKANVSLRNCKIKLKYDHKIIIILC